MASVTWPPRVTAAPISSSVKVARGRPGTAAARRPMRVARTGGTGTAVVDIGRSRRGGWRGHAPQTPPQPVPPTIARTAPATPPRSRARARPCKLQNAYEQAPFPSLASHIHDVVSRPARWAPDAASVFQAGHAGL